MNSPIHITLLGTGTSVGVPVIGCRCKVCCSQDPRDQRMRTSAAIRVDGKTIMIDCGPDFRTQLLKNDIRDIDGIVFTHGHRDHTGGLDDIRPINFIHHKIVPVWMTEKVRRQLSVDFRYMFQEEDKYPGVGEIEVFEFDDRPFFPAGPTEWTPIPLLHGHLAVTGFRIRDFVYITDCSRIPDDSLHLLKGVKTLVINALRTEPHAAHFTLEQAIEVSAQLGNPTTYFTHISHQMGLHAEINQSLPAHIQLAYDSLTIEC